MSAYNNNNDAYGTTGTTGGLGVSTHLISNEKYLSHRKLIELYSPTPTPTAHPPVWVRTPAATTPTTTPTSTRPLLDLTTVIF
jgi:hypothetical protein